MIYYFVRLDTPKHGQIFRATCTADVIADVLLAAAKEVALIAEDCKRSGIRINFTVEVNT